MAAQAEGVDGAITSITVTPLVDILLVVLIIFMATAPLISRRAMKVDVPKAAHHEKTATEALQITYNARRELAVGSQKMSLPELEGRLKNAVAAQPELHVTMAADQAIPYGDVIKVIDVVRGAGVKKIGLEVQGK